MDTARRGNYESGSDYVLEYGELRFTFNERDFTERVEQAASKLGFVDGPLGDDEREDLVNLAVDGEVHKVLALIVAEGAVHEAELAGGLLDALGEVTFVEREPQLAVLEHVVRAGLVVASPRRIHDP